jgi:glucokinase
MTKYCLAIDLGGTKITAAVAEETGKIIFRKTIATEAHKGKKHVLEILLKLGHDTIKESKIKLSQITKIGIGAPGPVIPAEGAVIEPPNLPGWDKVPLRDIFQDEFGKPVIVENDANAAAIAENLMGAGKGSQNMIYITVSTGIGGGLILNGKLYTGARGTAGEVGHMIVKDMGNECSCGARGCLEAMASGTALGKMGEKIYNRKIDAVEIEKLALAGDRKAQELINISAHYLGVGISNLVNILNPEVVVIGGGMSMLGNLLIEPVRKFVKENALVIPAGNVKIVKAKFGKEAGIQGAIALCRS